VTAEGPIGAPQVFRLCPLCPARAVHDDRAASWAWAVAHAELEHGMTLVSMTELHSNDARKANDV
jgi:hypothetical protein